MVWTGPKMLEHVLKVRNSIKYAVKANGTKFLQYPINHLASINHILSPFHV